MSESPKQITDVEAWCTFFHAYRHILDTRTPSTVETDDYQVTTNFLREAQDCIMYMRPFDITNVKGLSLTLEEYKTKDFKEQHGSRKVIWSDNT